MDACYGVLYALRLFLESTIMFWLVVSTHLKTISQNGNFATILRVKIQILKPPPSFALPHICFLFFVVFFSDFQHIHDKSSMETNYPSSNLPLGIQMSHKKKNLSLYWLFNRDPGSLFHTTRSCFSPLLLEPFKKGIFRDIPLYPINTHYIRCILGLIIKGTIPRGPHHFPYDRSHK